MQLLEDVQLCSRITVTLRLLPAAMGLLFAVSAAAQVTLSNSVKKVENFVNEDGQVERQLVDVLSVVSGDELRYTITFTNSGNVLVDGGSVVITNPIPESTEYLEGTAFGADTEIVFSTDGESFATANELRVEEAGSEALASAQDYTTIRWTFSPVLKPGETSHVSFDVRLK